LNDQINLMSSMQSLNSLTQLAQAVMTFNSSQAPVGATNTVNQVQAVGQILSSMQTSTGSNYVVVNGQMQAIPPTVPAPPSNVQAVLTAGGLKLVVPSSTKVAAPTTGAS
jgi:hypothetical protein